MLAAGTALPHPTKAMPSRPVAFSSGVLTPPSDTGKGSQLAQSITGDWRFGAARFAEGVEVGHHTVAGGGVGQAQGAEHRESLAAAVADYAYPINPEQ